MSDIRTTIQLNDGREIPQLGFGTWKLTERSEAISAIRTALETGYRHVDAASVYENEAFVGEAISGSSVPREELFITGKLWNQSIRDDREEKELRQSLRDLRVDYFDLYLIHWPVDPGFEKAWKKMESFVRQGLVRSIGVSNFTIPQLERLLKVAEITPAVNQISFHPYYQDNERIAFCRERNIAIEAWSPLGNGRIAEEATCREIGRKYGKSPAQVILRWILQKGIIVFPKSTKRERIRENADLFDFSLTVEEVRNIDRLNRMEYRGPDPNKVDF